ncbi:MAG: PaeR7I family type II restriction endonuclease [Candidatus Acidoferrales bacterium]
MSPSPEQLRAQVAEAVRYFWKTRKRQAKKQKSSRQTDQGARSAVTGGAQMDGFIQRLTDLIRQAGADDSSVFHSTHLQLPGYFRPTKEWDLLVVKDDQLVVAIEVKSQVGPSFGNNFNNRTEEAIGSAVDLWTAFREGALHKSVPPWLGYLFLVEECPASLRPVNVQEPHFDVFPEFKNASYAKRYELLCRKLVRERHYTASAFLMSDKGTGLKGAHKEPASDLTTQGFVRSLMAHVAAWGRSR